MKRALSLLIGFNLVLGLYGCVEYERHHGYGEYPGQERDGYQYRDDHREREHDRYEGRDRDRDRDRDEHRDYDDRN